MCLTAFYRLSGEIGRSVLLICTQEDESAPQGLLLPLQPHVLLTIHQMEVLGDAASCGSDSFQ